MRTTTTRTLVKTSLAVTAAAGVGVLATDPDSPWYRRLSKPPWQPPGPAYGIVWTPLYAMIAYAGGRAMDQATRPDRRSIGLALGVNLGLNAGWTALFFAAKSPKAALAEIMVLNVSNAALVRQVWKADRRAGLLLLPYAGWTVFATALNADIVRRNR
ncbi:MAG: TspO/MBR family protein [Streptosporangiaceae bacterium]